MTNLRLQARVESQSASMLDVAFNLLAFFIFTFKPAPMEVQFNLDLLPASPATEPETAPPPEDAPSDVPAPLRTLTTTLHADATGGISHIELDEINLDSLEELRERLEELLQDADLAFDQAVIRVEPELHYEELIQVIDLYAELKLTKISFTELN